MGGGDRNFEALRWFMKKAGNGHIVVLRASQAGEIGEEFFNEVGGIRSVETFVFNDREASTDPRILAALKRADGIFLAGGGQSWPCSASTCTARWTAAARPARVRWPIRWAPRTPSKPASCASRC